MIRKILSIILLAHTAIAEIKPDVSFTDNNNRFDLTEMVKAQNKMFRNIPNIDDDDDDEGVASDGDYRRHLRNYKTDNRRSIHIPHDVLTRREDFDFAYDPDNLPTIGRGGDDAMIDLEYQENLKNFKMNIPKPSRRKTLTEELKREGEILMQNVVPITLTIDGYLKAPLQDLVSLYAQQGKRVILKTE